jgi:hypothetical protein
VRSEDVQALFGAYTLASITAENPLPIQLLTFTAEPVGDQVHCAWTTASESNNAFFTVERSRDAWGYDPVGTVPGAGESQATLHYGFIDPEPFEGLSYYRLRQTDFDGLSTVSDAVPVLFQPPVDLRVAVDGRVFGNVAGSLLRVWDGTGRLIWEGRPTGADTFLPVQEWAPGTYVLSVLEGNAVHTVRFVR